MWISDLPTILYHASLSQLSNMAAEKGITFTIAFTGQQVELHSRRMGRVCSAHSQHRQSRREIHDEPEDTPQTESLPPEQRCSEPRDTPWGFQQQSAPGERWSDTSPQAAVRTLQPPAGHSVGQRFPLLLTNPQRLHLGCSRWLCPPDKLAPPHPPPPPTPPRPPRPEQGLIKSISRVPRRTKQQSQADD
ncbi:sal-like protein 2 [Anguilla anguilla]|uniref:sal-like protein 2 n=1 Tax=Anguilla anguilla TaxID=7936 RepID=UPI0015A9B1EB|nr:sal-like protein 2 [Anguilla anguilla]